MAKTRGPYKKAEITNEEVKNFITSRVIINTDTECWEWSRWRDKNGYGIVDSNTRPFRLYKTGYAHRVSYLAHKGDVPDGMVVRHRCNNKPCCNPAHLEVGTNSENMADKSEAISDRTTAALKIWLADLTDKIAAIQAEIEKRGE